MFTIGHKRVFSLTRWFSRIHTGPHVSRATQDPPVQFWISSTGLSPSVVLLSRRFDYPLPSRVGVLQPRNCRNSTRFGLVPFRSPLLRESLLFSFPPGTEMFHFPGFASLSGYPASGVGCPIRTSADSRLLTSPRSFSQLSHVLLRLLVPRHPPCALSNLTKKP